MDLTTCAASGRHSESFWRPGRWLGPNGARYFNIETVARVLGLTVEETEAKARKWLGPDALKPRDDISLVN